MRKESDMLFLVMSLLFWTQTEGGCHEPHVSISGDDMVLLVGQSFNLNCEFTCLRPQHVAQLWRDDGHEERVSLVNITSTLPNLTLVLNINSATKAHTGHYSCMTHPPDAISRVLIEVSDNLTVSTLASPSTPQHDSTQRPSSTSGLLGQTWFWILLGKMAILLLSLTALAVNYKRR